MAMQRVYDFNCEDADGNKYQVVAYQTLRQYQTWADGTLEAKGAITLVTSDGLAVNEIVKGKTYEIVASGKRLFWVS